MNVGRTEHRESPRGALPVGPESASATLVVELLSKAQAGPAALLVTGEAGIGKSTMWLAAVADARRDGFDVLAARAALGEATLPYACLADLLGEVDPAVWSNLPLLQRRALDQILLRDGGADVHLDSRTAATAVLSVIARLAATSPVLLAIDDLQWVDPASARVLSFVTRRLAGPVGVLATMRPSTQWVVDLPRTSDADRITLGPLSLGSLHAMLSRRLGRSLPRPALVRIHDTSGGNPFYALELARATESDHALPGTLVDVVRARIGSLDAHVQEALLAASALVVPTVGTVAAALGTTPRAVVGLLETAEDAGIVRLDGHRLRFAHPLLARGLYSAASPARRRRLHRVLADVVDDPELRARHLALGSATADPDVVALLDAAAASARRRGAHGGAAELLDLALGLGGDTPLRRIRSAESHFASGNVGHARALLERTLADALPGVERARALGTLAGIRSDDSLTAAADLLRDGLTESDEPSTVRIRMLLGQADARWHTGDLAGAVDSTEGAIAEARLLGDDAALARAVGMLRVLAMMRGDGLDVSEPTTPATTNDVLLLAWSGQLERAHGALAELAERCGARDDQHDQLNVAVHGTVLASWHGDFRSAAGLAAEATERAEQLGGDVPLAMAASAQATVDAYAGRISMARNAGHAALAAAERSGSMTSWRSAATALAFLESSQGEHAAVLGLVQPLLEYDARQPEATEIATAAYLPDAIEALIGLGRCAEADVLIDRLERNGRRLDRPWMLAIGSRCRAMSNAALGDLDGATSAIEAAMAHHDRLPMPFERARSQLVLGQLLRRRRHKDEAVATLADALATFEELDTPLWAARARGELARSNPGRRGASALTPSELAVAELAAAGMKNRDVAASLFISPKTVEANLARIYRKLGIRSRAELGSHMGQLAQAS